MQEIKNQPNSDGGGKGQWSAWKVSHFLFRSVHSPGADADQNLVPFQAHIFVAYRLPSSRKSMRSRAGAMKMNPGPRMSRRKEHRSQRLRPSRPKKSRVPPSQRRMALLIPRRRPRSPRPTAARKPVPKIHPAKPASRRKLHLVKARVGAHA